MKILKLIVTIMVTAAGLLLCHSCTRENVSHKEEMITTLTGEIKADSLKTYVEWLENLGTRFTLASNRRQVAMKIKNKFISFGYTDVKLDSFHIAGTFRGTYPYDLWQYNVIAKLEGTTNPDSLCIIGGHYDNILRTGEGDPFTTAYGANDNASGTAAALEVARVMKKNSYESRNTILFIAFGAEELGLLGSHAYANNAYSTSSKIRMMLNNDMIAYEPSSVKTDWMVNILDYDNSHDLRYKAEDLLHKFTVLNHTNINTYNKQSDSYPFSLKGYPAIFFFSNSSDPNYHTLSDLSGQCNFNYCAEIVKISCALLVDANTSN